MKDMPCKYPISGLEALKAVKTLLNQTWSGPPSVKNSLLIEENFTKIRKGSIYVGFDLVHFVLFSMNRFKC
jgi:hypothetical protein